MMSKTKFVNPWLLIPATTCTCLALLAASRRRRTTSAQKKGRRAIDNEDDVDSNDDVVQEQQIETDLDQSITFHNSRIAYDVEVDPNHPSLTNLKTAILTGKPKSISLDIGGSLAKVLVIEDLQQQAVSGGGGGGASSSSRSGGGDGASRRNEIDIQMALQRDQAQHSHGEVEKSAFAKHEAKAKARAVATSSGVYHYVDLTVAVPTLSSTLHFVSFETRYIDECLHFVSSVLQDIPQKAWKADRHHRTNLHEDLLANGPEKAVTVTETKNDNVSSNRSISEKVISAERDGDAAYAFGSDDGHVNSLAEDNQGNDTGASSISQQSRTKRAIIRATGGGAFQHAQRFNDVGVTLDRRDEIACLVNGVNFFIKYVDNELFWVSTNLQSLADTPSAKMKLTRHYLPRGRNVFPYLLVNIGSGVSVVKVEGPTHFARISGSSLGGSTFVGLASLFMPVDSFDEVMDCTSKGQVSKVDMLVGDIYTEDYAGLDKSVIASTFGKVAVRRREGRHHHPHGHEFKSDGSLAVSLRQALTGTFRLWMKVALDFPILGTVLTSLGLQWWPWLHYDEAVAAAMADHHHYAAGTGGEDPSAADYALSLLRMISNNIAQIAHLCAIHHGIESVIFTGNFVHGAHAQARATLAQAMDFWSQGTLKAHFMAHDGFAGALGAHLCGTPFSLKMAGNVYSEPPSPVPPPTVPAAIAGGGEGGEGFCS